MNNDHASASIKRARLCSLTSVSLDHGLHSLFKPPQLLVTHCASECVRSRVAFGENLDLKLRPFRLVRSDDIVVCVAKSDVRDIAVTKLVTNALDSCVHFLKPEVELLVCGRSKASDRVAHRPNPAKSVENSLPPITPATDCASSYCDDDREGRAKAGPDHAGIHKDRRIVDNSVNPSKSKVTSRTAGYRPGKNADVLLGALHQIHRVCSPLKRAVDHIG